MDESPQPPLILIVEDESKLLRNLQKGFEEVGYRVITASTGETGFDAALTHPVDVVILDVMLPSRSGFDVLSDLRRRGFDRPVLLLTARDTIADRVEGL